MRITFAFFIMLFLTSCASFNHSDPPPPEAKHFVFVKPDKTPKLNLQSPEWTVANQDELQELSQDPAKRDQIWYILTQEQFNQLMNNIIRMTDKLSKQDRVIDYYEKAVDDYDKSTK